MAINDKKVKYDSGINVLGSIPDYGAMLEFICEYTGKKSESEQAFSFRTHKTFNRFLSLFIQVLFMVWASPISILWNIGL